MKLIVLLILSACLCMASSSCVESRPSTTQPSDQALNDPFKYSPSMGDTDISGGKINEFDRNALKRDVDNVFSP
jgi:hypothetical protein